MKITTPANANALVNELASVRKLEEWMVVDGPELAGRGGKNCEKQR
jgi:hypothetical protein